MDYKTTLIHYFSILRMKGNTCLLFLFSFVLLTLSHAQAQTLKTDSNVPVLDVCSDYKQFTVRIAKGSQPCPNGMLKIDVPQGFELQQSSVMIDGNAASIASQAGQAVTVNVVIPAGPPSQEIEVTFNIRALCDIIGSATDSFITYTLTGCSTSPQTGISEAINFRYAVLRISVVPDPVSGNIGDEIERTVTVSNQGNGALSDFILDRNLGGGLSHVSYDFTSAVAAGWNVDASDINGLVFSGGTNLKLQSGASISFKEKVKIESCALMPTSYEVYYGCTSKCTNAGVNGTAVHIINLQLSNAPQLSVSKTKPLINCFNEFGENTWTITNTGSVATTDIAFEIGTQDAQGYINPASVTVNGNPATVIGTPGANPKAVKVLIPGLAPGASTTIKFDQYYAAPDVNPADCATAPTVFGNGNNYFNASFSYAGACAPVVVGKTMNEEILYSYDGIHIGEVDIIAGQNYDADFLFNSFKIPSSGLNIGDQFIVTVELAPDLNVNPADIKISTGATAVNVTATPNGANKYELVFTYGTAPWNVNTDLDLSFARLQFPMSFSCPANLDNLWYSIGGQLVKKNGASDCDPVVMKCSRMNLSGYCDMGPCPNGMVNGTAALQRVSVGHAVDASGTPVLPLSPSVNADTRTFLTGDILEIYQNSDVVISSGTYTKVQFVVDKDASINANLIAASGKIVVTRGGTDYPFTGLTVSETGATYVLDFDFTNAPALGSTLLNNDKIRMSLHIKSGNSQTGLKEFPTKSYLIDDTTGERILCGRTYTATGFYAAKAYSFTGGSASFINCSNESNSVVFSTDLLGFRTQDAIFKNEYRNLFVPVTAVLNVGPYLTMTAVKVTVKNQPWLGINNTTTVSGLNVNNTSYSLDLSQAIKNITGNGLDYLDEGFELEITPVVEISACEPLTNTKNQRIEVTLNGNMVDGEGVMQSYSNKQNLDYNTGIGNLKFETSNNDLNGRLSSDGTEVSWVVKVSTTGVRNFNSVWIAKKAGALVINTLEEVSNYNGNIVITALTPNAQNIYELGDFPAGAADKYYLITGSVINCSVESLILASGYSCSSNSYPPNVTTGCVLIDKSLTHKIIDNILQTEIVDQFNGNSAVKPDLCNEIWYTVQLHNAGDSKLNELKLTIPLASAPGLAYNNKFEYSNVFASNGGSATSYTTGNPADAVVVGNNLIISLPNTVELNSVERIRVKIYYKVNSCNFKSGAKHSVTPFGKNTCGTTVANITSATTKRIIVQGGSDAFPELKTILNELELDPVLTVGDNLRAIYNFEFINSGDFGVNDAITTDYRIAFKLPAGWSIVGNPNDYLIPAGKATYVGLDPVRGYVYQIDQPVLVGETIKLEDVPLKYTLNDETMLSCHHNFGEITVTVYQNISVLACNPTPDCSGNGIDQVLLEVSKSMVLPMDDLLTIDPPQQTRFICNPSVNGGAPTLADISFTNGYYLSWYENAQEAATDLPADRLPLNTPLIHNRTYYVINRFIADGSCKSNIGEIKVLLKDNNLKATATSTICAADDQSYQVVVTLSGTAPFVATGTGNPGTFNGTIWTSDPIAAGTPYNVTFTDVNDCTPLIVSGNPPVCCTLEITCPAAITVACGTSILPAVTGIPVVVRSCGNTTYDYTDSVITACANGVRTFTRTFTVTDTKGNKLDCSQVISIQDNTAPVFNGALPADLNVSCASEVPPAAQMTATDTCGTATVTFSESRTNGTCANNFILERTWTATDECGNTQVHIQTIMVNDSTAPVFNGTLPADVTVSCSTDVPAAVKMTAADNCGTATVTFSENRINGSCDDNYTLIRIWTAADECGNETEYIQIITVDDKTAPLITVPAENKTVECDGAGNLTELQNWLTGNGGASATDNCGTVIWSNDYDSSNFVMACGNTGSVKVIFTATDACGNSTQTDGIFTIIDTGKPGFAGTLPPAVITASCDNIPATVSLTATDVCGTATVTFTETRVDGLCANSYDLVRTWTATDECGNISTYTQTIKVVDNEAPVFNGILPANVTYSCNAEVPIPAVLTATDNCGVATVTFTETRTDGACGNNYILIRTWTATDVCGNKTQHTQTITVDDKTAPVFTTAPENVIVECDGAGNLTEFNAWLASYGGSSATDNCGAVTMSHHIEDTNTICGYAGTVIVNFIATDSCGNKAFKQAAFIIRDTMAPVIGTMASDLTIECGTGEDALNAWLNNHGGAVASDLCGTVTWTHNYNGLTTLGCGTTGSALVTFTATDSCGNSSTTQATVSIVDTQVPVLVKAAQSLTVSCSSNTSEQLTNWLNNHAGSEASDSCSVVTWTNNYVAGNFIAACGSTGHIDVTFTGSDACGNTVSTTATFTIEDKTAPVLVKAAQNKTVECDGSGNTTELQSWLSSNAGAVASDTCDADLTWTNDYVTGNFVSACGTTGSVTVTFKASDECGNTVSTTAVFTITDTEKPIFTTAPENVIVECDGAGNLTEFNAWLAGYGGSSATDNCGAVTMSHHIEDTNTICGYAGTVIVDFIATDSCGNKAFKQAAFIIRDTTAPVIGTMASDLTIECGTGEDALNAWLNNHGGAVASDMCGTVTWTHNYNGLTTLGCGTTGSALVTFTATDSCGNSSTTQATVSIVDTQVPVLVKAAQSLTVSCSSNTSEQLTNWLNNHAGSEASDSCSVVTWTNNYVAGNFVTACGSTGHIDVTFTGSDVCGNMVSTTATFTIEDKTAPVLVKAAQNKTVECDGSGNTTELQSWLSSNAGAVASDTCDADLTWTNDYAAGNFVSACGATGSVTVSFKASDACGNTVSTTAVFTITDTEKPIFTTAPENVVVECDGAGNLTEFNAWLSGQGNGIAEDGCGTVTYSYTVADTSILCGKTGTTVVNFTATDSCGNSTIKQASFTIVDTGNPVISTAAASLTVECGGNSDTQITTWLNNHGGAVASDLCGTVTWTHNYNGLTTLGCGTTGSALVTFTATDSCGNSSTTQATVSIVDTQVPVLVKAAQSLTVSCSSNTSEQLTNWLNNHAGSEASDSCSVVTWTNNYVGGNFVTACGSTGHIDVTFTGSDACGNTVSTTATFTIEDKTAPVLVKAAQNKTVECDGLGNTSELQSWLSSNAGAVASDICDADLTWTNDYVTGNFVSACGATGSVTVTFKASDACGNTVSTTAVFTITDTEKPVFTTAPENVVVECDGAGNLAEYNAWLSGQGNGIAEDGCGTVTYSYTVADTSLLCGKTGTTIVNFTATDSCGNSAIKQASFTIADTTAPQIVIEAQDKEIECDGTGSQTDLMAWLSNNGGAKAEDTCSGSPLTWSHNFEGLTKSCGGTGSTQVTFYVTDACGNTSQTTAVFTITDTTPPVFNTNLPQDRTIECSDSIPEVAVVTADDSCSKAAVSFKEERVNGSCENNYELVRTWTASDACGNKAEHIQVITVQDTTAPEFVGELPSEEIFIRCEDLKDPVVLKAVDNCGTAVVTSSDEVVRGECDTKYVIMRTWTAVDNCNNKATFTQKINLSCKVEVFNAVTPNGDGKNDELVLNGIECYPDNTVEIYNRWGVLVYETRNYNSRGNTFKGYSEGRATINKDPKLPTGTYYYVIRYNYDLGGGQVYPIQQAGYLHLETNK